MVPTVLLLCFGNPGRLDDGLGAAFARAVQDIAPHGVRVETNYQLSIEDAALIPEFDIVVFVDAAVSGPEPFSFDRVEPDSSPSFSTHHLSPEALLFLSRELFSARTEAYALGIKGYSFNQFGEYLSAGARTNLAAALDFFFVHLRDRKFSSVLCTRNLRDHWRTKCETGSL